MKAKSASNFELLIVAFTVSFQQIYAVRPSVSLARTALIVEMEIVPVLGRSVSGPGAPEPRVGIGRRSLSAGRVAARY